MTNQITYSGKVTIKVKDGKKIKKTNSGTKQLFKTLSSILSGSPDTLSLPCFMSVIHNNNKQVTSETIQNNLNYTSYEGHKVTIPLPITSKQINSETCSCTLSCFLPHNYVLGSVLDDITQSSGGFVLLLDGNSKTEQKVLAFVELSDLKFIYYVAEKAVNQVAIDWEMSFNNSDKE